MKVNYNRVYQYFYADWYSTECNLKWRYIELPDYTGKESKLFYITKSGIVFDINTLTVKSLTWNVIDRMNLYY